MPHPFDDLFFPKSIAIIGASPNMNFGSFFFIEAYREMQFAGKIYYVNPKYKGQIINGEKVIKSLDDVDGKIDVVYSCIRASLVPDLVRQCVRRGDKFIVVFTSGFSEILTVEAIKLEKELLSIIKGSATRIIGPNCLGPFNPAAKIGWTVGLSTPKRLGNVGFGSQSGGHASILLRVSSGRGFYYSKGLSFGNQIDINCLDLLEYYATDPQTEVIALYVEDTGSAKGSEFFKKLKEVTLKKPVIIWKGGQTKSGARAAASHTGAISGSLNIWKSMTKQAGGIFVEQSEEFWDIIHLLAVLIPHHKLKLCKRLGLIIPGGGASVEGTDLVSRFGFEVPVLSQETQDKISALIPAVNTSVKNPVDLGSSGTLESVFINSVKFVSEENNIDFVINFQPMDWIAQGEKQFGGKGYSRVIARAFGRLVRKLKKPLIQLSPIFEIDKQVAEIHSKFIEILRQKGIPIFPSMRRMAVALIHLNEYVQYLKSHGKREQGS